MREGLRYGISHAFTLQSIIADGAGGAQCLLDIALLQHLAAAIGMIAPEPGKTVRLQFKLHQQGVRLGLAGAALGLPDLVADTQQVLHMVTDLVGNDIGLGKITGRTVPLFKVPEERQVEIHLVVRRAVERTHRSGRHATGGLHGTAEHHPDRFLVIQAAAPEDGVPGILRVRKHHGNEVGEFLLFR